MLIKSGVIASGSGSMGGITLSHNKGGMYFRARAIPTNPGTQYQQAVRTRVANMTVRWNDVLTATQRDAWEVYAANTPLIGPLGDPITVSGMNMYIRANAARGVAVSTPIDDAPTVYNLGSYTDPTITVSATSDEVSVAFEPNDEWAGEDGSFMLVYASRPQNPAVNYFKGPYRFAGEIAGNGTTPPTSPADIALPFPVDAGQRVFIRIVVSRIDGRVSHDFRTVGLAA